MKQVALAALISIGAAAPAIGASYDDLNAGIQLYNLGDWNAAVLKLDQALAANDLVPSLNFVAHFDRGQAHRNLSHYDQAIADFSASLELRPVDPLALSARSLAYFGTGKLDQAASDLDALIAIRPMLTGAYGLRAAVNAKRGRAGESVKDLKTVLSLQPKNAGYGLETGILAWEVGEIDDAQDNFSSVVSKGPGNIYAWLWDALARTRLSKEIRRGSLPKFDKDKWPAPIVALYLGESTQDAVFAAAAQGETQAIPGQSCEANFYVGEWLLQHQDRTGAAPLIRKAAAQCPTGFVEWNPAQLELANLP